MYLAKDILIESFFGSIGGKGGRGQLIAPPSASIGHAYHNLMLLKQITIPPLSVASSLIFSRISVKDAFWVP